MSELGGALHPLYRSRRLSAGYPDLDRLSLAKFQATLSVGPNDTRRIERLFQRFARLVDLHRARKVLVLGCGPRPQAMEVLQKLGYSVLGVDPIPSFVRAAGAYLGDPANVLVGEAEQIPLPTGSQDVVLFESVLEHVDSPLRSLEEIHRVLRPGGLAYVSTTNRLRLSPTGANGEFAVPFYNWLPAVLKESYVFFHLHYDPRIANYTERPAVYWFSYADLCALGRSAGFERFYSPVDLPVEDEPSSEVEPKSADRLARRLALRAIRSSPWARALALTQVGGEIVMLKRRRAGP